MRERMFSGAFIGAHDRDGRPIHEGNIVKYMGKLYRVYYNPDIAGFVTAAIDGDNTYRPCLNYGTTSSLEVCDDK